MAIKIKSLKEASEDNGIKCLVHGPAGIGKTVLCATTGAKTLIISAEGGLLSIKDAPGDIDVVEVKSLADVAEIYEMLRDEEHPFDWICLDSISEIAEVVLAYEKDQNKDGRKAYMEMADQMSQLIRDFRDLPHVNVLMTSKQQRIADDLTGLVMYHPSMPGKKLAEGLGYLFDEVFAMRILKDAEGEKQRYLQTERDESYEAKDRSGYLDEFEEANMELIYKKIHAGIVEEDDDEQEEEEEEKAEKANKPASPKKKASSKKKS